MAKYNSRRFLEVYNTFFKMFEEEGETVYNTIKESIENDYEHSALPDTLQKTVLLSILNDVLIDFYQKHIKIIDIKEYLKIETNGTL